MSHKPKQLIDIKMMAMAMAMRTQLWAKRNEREGGGDSAESSESGGVTIGMVRSAERGGMGRGAFGSVLALSAKSGIKIGPC